MTICFVLDGKVRLVSVNNVVSNKPTIRILCLYRLHEVLIV